MRPDTPLVATWDPNAQPPADPGGWCWHARSWDEAALESVQPATGRTRGQAAMRYLRDIGEYDIREVGVWKRYARALTIQEQWEHHCDDLGWSELDPESDDDGAEREMSPTPPQGWTPDPWNEDMPVWAFCFPDDPGAVPVWIVGPREGGGPHQPIRRAKA